MSDGVSDSMHDGMHDGASAPRYFSSRDPRKTLVSFETALLRGLAPDGGLYLPEFVPTLSTPLDAPSFAEAGVQVLGAWLAGELPAPVLAALVRDALTFDAPVVQLDETLWVLELFHGPTRSFKDVGARVMARLMQHFLARRNERRVVLVATSGDTGSAVADGFAGMPNLEVVLLYPKGKVSAVQERQLIVARPGVRALAVEGDFDDCQRLVKLAFADKALARVPLTSANSINVGRLLPQTVYYLWGASQLPLSTAPVISVPSGNLGNLTAALLAARMGQEVKRFLAAHNANRYFPDFLAEAVEAFAFPKTVATRSSAMDVGAPSNFERLIELFGADELRERIWATSVDDDATLDRMNAVYTDFGYLVCPHTAVGIEAAVRYRAATGDETPILVVATAHPAKFPEALREALDIEPPEDEVLEEIWRRETRVRSIPAKLAALRAVLLETDAA